jgi:hypothetical protein
MCCVMCDVWAGCVTGTVLCLLQDAMVHAEACASDSMRRTVWPCVKSFLHVSYFLG